VLHSLQTESLESAFQKHGISIDVEARHFYNDVWALIKLAEDIRDDSDMLALDKRLRQMCQRYFAEMRRWTDQTKAKYPKTKWCKEGRQCQREAADLMEDFEKLFHKYMLFYMHLNRHILNCRKGLKKISADFEAHKFIKTEDLQDTAGHLINRAYKEKKRLIQKRERLVHVQSVLSEMDGLFDNIRQALISILGHREADQAYTSFRAALRKGDFKRAEAAMERWSSRKRPIGASREYRRAMMTVQHDGTKIICLIKNNLKDLEVKDGYILNLSEINLIFSFMMSDEERVNRFLEKYNYPFMILKFRQLLKLAYKLGQMGSIETMLVLHAKLATGQAHPIETAAQAQKYDQEILQKTGYLTRKTLPEMPGLFDSMEMTAEQIHLMIRETLFMTSQPKSIT